MTQLAQRGGNAMAGTDGLMVDDDLVVLDKPTQDVLSPATRAEVDIQISTAKRFPRNLATVKDAALTMATLDEETAAGCMYALPRGGKTIEGPSVRLAEIMLNAWGNVRADARVVDVGQREITAEGMCWDLERNIAIRCQVKRRITDSKGRRYNDDMIVTTGNAASSIALRNAVLKVIPLAMTKVVYRQARLVAVGDAKTLATSRASMVEYFGKMGVKPEQVSHAVERPSIEDITLDDLATLKGIATAIREGGTTVDEAFPPLESDKPTGGGSRTDSLASKLGAAGIAPDVAKAAADIEQKREAAKAATPAKAAPKPDEPAAATGEPPAPRQPWPNLPRPTPAKPQYWRAKMLNAAAEAIDSTGGVGELSKATPDRLVTNIENHKGLPLPGDEPDTQAAEKYKVVAGEVCVAGFNWNTALVEF